MKIEALILRDSGGTEAHITAANALKVDGSAVIQPVSATSLPLPTGAATEVTLSAIDAILTSIDAGIPVALGQTTMANSMPVVLASDQTDININIRGNAVGLATEATLTVVNNTIRSTIFADDIPHNDGDSGHFILGVRNDNLTTTHTDANGDYSPLSTDAKGALYISGIAIETFLQNIDAGTPAALGQTTMANSMPVVIASDQSAIPVSGPLTDAQLRASAVPISASTLPLPTGAATEVTLAAIKTAVELIDNAISGTEMQVDIVASLPAGSNLIGSVTAVGDVAHDSPDSGNPVKIGGHVEQGLPTAAANGDRANVITDRYGRILVNHIDPASFVWKAHNSTSTQTGVTIWQPSTANHRIAITKLTIGTYGTTSARVIIWFGSSADTTYTAGTDQLVFAGSFSPSSTSKPGAILTFPIPEVCQNTNYYLKITTDAAISIDVAVSGYEFIP